MDPKTSAAELRHQMQAIRENLRPEMQGIVSSARQLTDWHYYVRAFPWASVAAAAIVGYAVVPTKPRIVRPDEEMLARLAKDNKVVFQQTSKPERASMAGALLSVVGSLALRAGLAYANQQIGQVFKADRPQPVSPKGEPQ